MTIQVENLMKRYVFLGTEDVFQDEIAAKKSLNGASEMLPEGTMSLPEATREMRTMMIEVVKARHLTVAAGER